VQQQNVVAVAVNLTVAAIAAVVVVLS